MYMCCSGLLCIHTVDAAKLSRQCVRYNGLVCFQWKEKGNEMSKEACRLRLCCILYTYLCVCANVTYTTCEPS